MIDHEPHGGYHVEIGPGEGSVFQRQAARFAPDQAAIEMKFRLIGADRRHRIGYQKNPARPLFCTDRDLDSRRVDMNAIGKSV